MTKAKEEKKDTGEALKKTRSAPTGMALEMDVMKKIGHQLSRLTDPSSGERIIEYVRKFTTSPVGPQLTMHGNPPPETDEDIFS